MSQEANFATIPEALEEIRNGGIVIVMDDENRENEGDLVMAAEKATPEKVAFIINECTGILCAPMPPQRAADLKLKPMVLNNTDPKKTAFTKPVDTLDAGTGVSAENRCKTFLKLANPSIGSDAFHKPGHVYPLVARPGGVLERDGHTEASVDLCRLAGVEPVAIISEIKSPLGHMKRLDECVKLAKQYNLKLITVAQIKAYRVAIGDDEYQYPVPDVEIKAKCKLPVAVNGRELETPFTLLGVLSYYDWSEHYVLTLGNVTGDLDDPVLVRVHSECFTGDILGSLRCDCGEQLRLAQEIIAKRGRGVVVYNKNHEGRGIGGINKILAYADQQDHGRNTFESNNAIGFEDDLRTYETAIAILKKLGVQRPNMLTSNRDKLKAFEAAFVKVDLTPLEGTINPHNQSYMHVKRNRHGILPNGAASEADLVAAHSKAPPINFPPHNDTTTMRVGIVHAGVWNAEFMIDLFSGVRRELLDAGVVTEHIDEMMVPGSFELPRGCQMLIKKHQQLGKPLDVVIALGVLIKGDSLHFEMISHAVVQGIMTLQLNTETTIINGVLNCLTSEQARVRCREYSLQSWSFPNSALMMASNAQNASTIVLSTATD